MKTILVATDLSPRSDRAVLRAAHLARESNADLRIVHVIDDDVPAAVLQTRTEEAERLLSAMIADSALLTDLGPAVSVEAGHIERLLPRMTSEGGIDLLVLGSHRNRGLSELLGAPTLSRLLRGVTVPVLIAIGRPEEAYATVSVGWDFSPAGEAALTHARAVAPTAEITLVNAWQEVATGAPYAFETGGFLSTDAIDDMRSEMMRAAATHRGEASASLGAEVGIGPAAVVLRRRAETGEADLLAMGRHARAGLARLLLGSTAEDVALSATCDVLIAPAI
ncbi:universal stress protein [Jannaschia sp. 2305UL9-9]|uniref:universal stress protein n=1 Tax=Jannaschia sp. 2305UL9-9 TaxID=3121638 RepID=UPI00352800DB